jgi:hypothetical protein
MNENEEELFPLVTGLAYERTPFRYLDTPDRTHFGWRGFGQGFWVAYESGVTVVEILSEWDAAEKAYNDRFSVKMPDWVGAQFRTGFMAGYEDAANLRASGEIDGLIERQRAKRDLRAAQKERRKAARERKEAEERYQAARELEAEARSRT